MPFLGIDYGAQHGWFAPSVRIVEDVNMVDYVEDWSRVRSPGRARRRRHRHPQNIRTIAVPKREAVSIDGGRTLVMHPELARQLREAIR